MLLPIELSNGKLMLSSVINSDIHIITNHGMNTIMILGLCGSVEYLIANLKFKLVDLFS